MPNRNLDRDCDLATSTTKSAMRSAIRSSSTPHAPPPRRNVEGMQPLSDAITGTPNPSLDDGERFGLVFIAGWKNQQVDRLEELRLFFTRNRAEVICLTMAN
jgi:hypothetical protein